MKNYRQIIAMALGERDGAIGKPPMLKRPEYLWGYSRQYEKEQRSIAINEEAF